MGRLVKNVSLLLCILLAVFPLLVLGQGECSRTEPCADATMCCSVHGYCGHGDSYCGPGCQGGPCYATTTTTTSTSGTSGPVTTGSSSTTGGGGWPNGPVKSLYVNSRIDWTDPSITFKAVVDAGYNLVILAFFISGAPADAVVAWEELEAAGQQATISYAHARNARIILSAGGATDIPYDNFTGTQYGTDAANWAKSHYLDGVDLDLEHFGPGFTAGSLSTAASIQWCVDATNAVRNIMGASAIITHAPQPPYFGPNGFSDAYTAIYQKAPSISYLQIQYYNNGPSYTYSSIYINNNGAAVKEISANIPLNKLIVGKPVTPADAGVGYIDAATFHSFVTQAQQELGWTAGVMGWQWRNATTNGDWIQTIYP